MNINLIDRWDKLSRRCKQRIRFWFFHLTVSSISASYDFSGVLDNAHLSVLPIAFVYEESKVITLVKVAKEAARAGSFSTFLFHIGITKSLVKR